jgi:hypothetical protein
MDPATAVAWDRSQRAVSKHSAAQPDWDGAMRSLKDDGNGEKLAVLLRASMGPQRGFTFSELTRTLHDITARREGETDAQFAARVADSFPPPSEDDEPRERVCYAPERVVMELALLLNPQPWVQSYINEPPLRAEHKLKVVPITDSGAEIFTRRRERIIHMMLAELHHRAEGENVETVTRRVGKKVDLSGSQVFAIWSQAKRALPRLKLLHEFNEWERAAKRKSAAAK